MSLWHPSIPPPLSDADLASLLQGALTVLAEAWARAKEEIATSTYTLTSAKEHEIDALYARAQEYLRRRVGRAS